MSEITKARQLSDNTLNAILDHYPDLKEVTKEGDCYKKLFNQQKEEKGAMRLFHGEKIERLVYIGLDNTMQMRHLPGNPEGRIDSHMIFAFTNKESAVPHFTLDSIYTMMPGMPAPVLAFHLDMIPRVDIGARLGYMNAVYGGSVSEAQAEAKKNEGFTPAALNSFQLGVMSPWMMASRATPEAFDTIPSQVYLERWFKLVDEGIPADALDGLTGADFADRDKRNRAVLFSKEVDPVWEQIERVIGADVGEFQREWLQRQDASQD